MVVNKIGPPVEGSDFFGREKEIDFAWKRLQDGNHLILPAPRRVGKSSFAKKLMAIAREAGWDTLEINLEKVHNEPAFIELFLEKLKGLSWWEKTKDRAASLLNQIQAIKPTFTYGDAAVSIEWQRQKADVYSKISDLLDHGKNTLIFFDELAVLLNSIVKAEKSKEQVENYLHWLRSLRQVSDTKIRWIFCSSVGIENFTYAHQLSNTINDVHPYQLKAFDTLTSLKLLEALEQSYQTPLTEEVRQGVLDKIGYLLPFFIQVLFGKIHELISLEQHPVNKALVDQAYANIIEESHLNTWVERLKEQYGDLETDAFLLLRHICQEKKGSKRSNLLDLLQHKHNDLDKAEDRLSTLLYMLKNDGYLMDEGGFYYFRSPLIRDFWHNRFVK
jgi:AAA+ ATPase superfamily predicted ATPase